MKKITVHGDGTGVQGGNALTNGWSLLHATFSTSSSTSYILIKTIYHFNFLLLLLLQLVLGQLVHDDPPGRFFVHDDLPLGRLLILQSLLRLHKPTDVLLDSLQL